MVQQPVPLKIAFLPAGGESWLGGVELLKNQLYVLRRAYENEVLICLLESSNSSSLSEAADVRIPLDYPSRYSASWFLRMGLSEVREIMSLYPVARPPLGNGCGTDA